MVIGQVEERNCPICNSDATWRNNGNSWKISCTGFCEDYSILYITTEYVAADIARRVDAMELLKQKILNTTLTNTILADYAKGRHTQQSFETHYPGF